MSIEMKTLTIGSNTYEIVDEQARASVAQAVKTVNGVAPDETGNVVVAGGTGSAVTIDDTLSVEGQAADAKATGNALARKLAANQGSDNAGKYLGISSDGAVMPVDAPEGGTVELDTTLSVSGQAADAKVVGDKFDALSEKMAELGDGLSTTEKTMLLSLFKNAAYTADMSATIAQLETLWSGDEEPDEPVTPDVTLSSISATYSGGSVPVGTAASSLTGVNVTAHYSDGSTATVTGYTLSGTIVEGNNTITVSYGGKTTTFTVTGVTDESGGDTEVSGDEYVVVTGATATDDGNGNVTVTGLTATDDRNGNITVS